MVRWEEEEEEERLAWRDGGHRRRIYSKHESRVRV
jgi:hypothetical protein